MATHESYYTRGAEICEKNGKIPAELYTEYDVKKGLRDKNGKGVVTGITNISRVDGYKTVGDERVPMDGVLAYRGYAIEDLISGHSPRCGFEESSYLLIFGDLPDSEELKQY